MSDEQLEAVETFLLQTIANAHGQPLSADNLVEAAAREGFSPADITQAVWLLVTSGRLDFTPEWNVVAAA